MTSPDEPDLQRLLAGLDDPRPLPPRLRDRLAAVLELDAGGLPAGLDAPRPVPSTIAARVTGALLARPHDVARLRRIRFGAAAAVVLVLLGSLAAVTRPVDDRAEADVAAAPDADTSEHAPRTKPTATATSVPPSTTTTTAGGATVVAMDESEPAYARLERFDGCGELLDWVRSRAVEEVTEYGLGFPAPVPASGGAATAPDGPAGQTGSGLAGGASGTNVQEAGVDEPDVVETDGRALYFADGRRVHAVAAGTNPTLVSTTPIGDDQRSAHSLVLDGDRLAVIASAYADEPSTEVYVLGVNDPASPSDRGGVALSGSYVQARATEHVLHVVTTSAPGPFPFTYPTDGSEPERRRALEENRRVIAASSTEDWLPDGVACDSVRRPRDFSGFSTTTVWSVPFADPAAATSTALLAGSSTMYASADRLVLATQQWEDTQPPGGDTAAPPPPSVRTQLHRFALAPEGATYLASGSVPGYLLSSYALSERDGYLRVASTDRPPWGAPADQPSTSTVTVLAQEGDVLVPVGAVGGLGEGEQIQGVRFVDHVAFVVTFRQVDPLYVIDLSDPTAPRLRGELHVTGFSAYLHPLGGGRLLGVGIEADDQGVRQGGAVSMYDVSDPDEPTLAQRVETADTHYLAMNDPHAFLLWEPTGMVVLPAYTSSGGVADVFRVDDGRLALQGRVTHSQIARAVHVDGVLFTVGGDGVLASDADTLAELGWAPFPTS